MAGVRCEVFVRECGSRKGIRRHLSLRWNLKSKVKSGAELRLHPFDVKGKKQEGRGRE